MSLPEPQDELDKILMWFVQDHIDFYSMDAESKQAFIEDTDGAKKTLRRYFASLKPEKRPKNDMNLNTAWESGFNTGLDEFESRILGGRHD